MGGLLQEIVQKPHFGHLDYFVHFDQSLKERFRTGDISNLFLEILPNRCDDRHKEILPNRYDIFVEPYASVCTQSYRQNEVQS